jgi:hypothetical protein
VNLEKGIKAFFHFIGLLDEPDHAVMPSADALLKFFASRRRRSTPKTSNGPPYNEKAHETINIIRAIKAVKITARLNLRRRCLDWLQRLERGESVVVNFGPMQMSRQSLLVSTGRGWCACWNELQPTWITSAWYRMTRMRTRSQNTMILKHVIAINIRPKPTMPICIDSLLLAVVSG